METQFLLHNTHFDDPEHFSDLDPQLRQLKNQTYVYQPKLLDKLPTAISGIYTLTGGRQIGKTTSLKQWMAKLLTDNVPPLAIAFFSGELIDNFHALLRIIQKQLDDMQNQKIKYLLIDEITYIKDWDKAVKYAADAGLLENVILILTGSDSVLIQQARMRFPGRRGQAAETNFHLYPLSFREVLELKKQLDAPIDVLFEEFNDYLKHGGYLTAINDFAANGNISNATLTTYSDWVRGDMLKRGKQEHYLREVLSAIIKRYNSQVTWNALARDLSIDHPKTVADYAELLASMDALFIQSALLEDKLTAAPKKARKLIFSDPFIYHAVNAWLNPNDDAYHNQILPAITDTKICSGLVEACVAIHYSRFYPVYYIKADGEVDIAYVSGNRFYPIEIKWANQLRAKGLKQILKYSNSIILSKNKQPGKIQHVNVIPLPLALRDLKFCSVRDISY